jgi:nitrogen fixation protein FixH
VCGWPSCIVVFVVFVVVIALVIILAVVMTTSVWWGTIVIILKYIIRVRNSANTSDAPDKEQYTGGEKKHPPRFATYHCVKCIGLAI